MRRGGAKLRRLRGMQGGLHAGPLLRRRHRRRPRRRGVRRRRELRRRGRLHQDVQDRDLAAGPSPSRHPTRDGQLSCQSPSRAVGIRRHGSNRDRESGGVAPGRSGGGGGAEHAHEGPGQAADQFMNDRGRASANGGPQTFDRPAVAAETLGSVLTDRVSEAGLLSCSCREAT